MIYYSRKLDETDLEMIQAFLLEIDLVKIEKNKLLSYMEQAEEKSYKIGIFNENQDLIGLAGLIEDSDTNYWDFKFFIIKKDQRNQGLGKKVYDDLEEWMVDLGCQKVTVVLDKDYYSSLSFFSQLKFKIESQNSDSTLMFRIPIS